MFTFFPTVDLTFIIGVVMSLLAILFTYDVIAGEREAGTLALIASNAVKRNTLLLGKWLGGFVSLIIPCFAALPVGILIIYTNPMIMLSLEDWQSLVIIFAITLVYLSAFLSVGILISCIMKRSSTAGLMLLFLWAIFVFVIPNISPYAARAIYPIPPHSQIVRQEKLLESDLDVKRRQRHESAALEVIEKKLSKEEAFQIIGQIQSGWLKEKKQRLTNMDGDYLRKVQRQEQISKEISSISPYACFMYLVNGLANTDTESHERFLNQTARYDGEYFSTESNEKPRFHYEDAAVAERLGHSLPQLIILLLLNGLFLILGFVVFLRADVTK